MKTNELKKGMRVLLSNGWEATLEDNLKGNIRMATVYGYMTEIGSVYAHDIVMYYKPDGLFDWHYVTHTPAQLKLQKSVERMFV
jgi:hypothetical protein